jgi:hypothetical protein
VAATEGGGSRDLASARIAVEVCIDACRPEVVARFWSALLDYRAHGDLDAGWVHLEPPPGRGPVLNVQRVPEGKSVKNRLHLDLFVDDPEPWVLRCEELGATRVRLHDHPQDWFQVMADPEGNEFCICREHEAPPG